MLDLSKHVKIKNNPVLMKGTQGEWDADCAGFGSIVRTTEGKLRMYYTGQNSEITAIGIAESEDGVQWGKRDGNPVMKGDKGAWDEKRCDLPTVWYEQDEYKMIYRGVNRANEVRVGLATSVDGYQWIKCDANPVWDDQSPWAHGHNEPWGLLKYRGEYILFYTNLFPKDPKSRGWKGLKQKVHQILVSRRNLQSLSNIKPRQVGCTVSKDLIHWQAVSDEPIFRSSGNPADWNYAQICPYVFRFKETFFMLLICRPRTGRPSRMALYKCDDPFFKANQRSLVGVLFNSSKRGWGAPFVDTPFVFSEDISRTLDLGNNEVRVYYTAGRSGRLQTGLVSFPMELLN